MSDQTPGTRVVYQNIPTAEPMNLRCRQCLVGFSIANLVLAGLVFILAITAVAFGTTVMEEHNILVGVDGSGLWGGGFLLITSAIGVAGILKKNRCQIRAYFIMMVIAVMVIGVVVFTMALIWAALGMAMAYYYHRHEATDSESVSESVAAIEGAMSFLTFLYLAFGLVIVIILCLNFCTCCGGKQLNNQPVVQYATTGGNTATGGSQGTKLTEGAAPSAPLMEPSPAPPPYEERAYEKKGIPPV